MSESLSHLCPSAPGKGNRGAASFLFRLEQFFFFFYNLLEGTSKALSSGCVWPLCGYSPGPSSPQRPPSCLRRGMASSRQESGLDLCSFIWSEGRALSSWDPSNWLTEQHSVRRVLFLLSSVPPLLSTFRFLLCSLPFLQGLILGPCWGRGKALE